MTLRSELDALKSSWEQRVGEEVAATVATHNDALRRSGIPERALGVGAAFPDVALTNARGGRTRICDKLARDGTIALAFVDPDYRRRLEPSAALDALRSLEEQT